MKAAEIIVGGLMIGLGLGTVLIREALYAFRKHFDHWHPAEPKVVGGNMQRYTIEKFGETPIEIAKFSIRAKYYDDLVSQAESDCITKCVALNSSQKTLRRYKG